MTALLSSLQLASEAEELSLCLAAGQRNYFSCILPLPFL